jgi:hypothetical protein
MKTADDILREEFEASKQRYPSESWKQWDQVAIEREFCSKAMHEYARQVLEEAASRAEVTILTKNISTATGHLSEGVEFTVDKQSILQIISELK